MKCWFSLSRRPGRNACLGWSTVYLVGMHVARKIFPSTHSATHRTLGIRFFTFVLASTAINSCASYRRPHSPVPLPTPPHHRSHERGWHTRAEFVDVCILLVDPFRCRSRNRATRRTPSHRHTHTHDLMTYSNHASSLSLLKDTRRNGSLLGLASGGFTDTLFVLMKCPSHGWLSLCTGERERSTKREMLSAKRAFEVLDRALPKGERLA